MLDYAINTIISCLLDCSLLIRMFIMFNTFLAEIDTTEEASNARDGVIMVILYQVHVDTRSVIRTGTGNELVP